MRRKKATIITGFTMPVFIILGVGIPCYLICSLFSWNINFHEWNIFSNIIKWGGVILIVYLCCHVLRLSKKDYDTYTIPRRESQLFIEGIRLCFHKLSDKQKFAILKQCDRFRKLAELNSGNIEETVIQMTNIMSKGLDMKLSNAVSFFQSTEMDEYSILSQLKNDRDVSDMLVSFFYGMTQVTSELNYKDDLDYSYEVASKNLYEKCYHALGYSDLEAAEVIKKSKNAAHY
jgi:hypothetical protein